MTRHADGSELATIALGSAPSGDRHEWTALFGGDCLLERDGERTVFDPSLVRRMCEADVTVVNQEGPIADAGEAVTKSGYVKQSGAETPAIHAEAGVDAVNLANNHVMDYGPAGLGHTLEAFDAVDIETVGAGADVEAALAPHVRSIGDVSVGLIGVCEREYGVAGVDDPGTAWVDHPNSMARIEAVAAEVDVLAVCVHAGIEYVPLPPPHVRERCRAIVEAGADVVIGHHPHVAQGWEVVDGAPVLYSLGNLVFDQPNRPATERGLAVELSFAGDTPEAVTLVPTDQARGTTSVLSDDQDRQRYLEHLHDLAGVTADDDAHAAHWQEVADRVFQQRYGRQLRRVAGGDPVNLARDVGHFLGRGGLWDPQRRRPEMLILLNLLRNESHRASMETALEVRTGLVADRRTEAVTRRVKRWFEWTEDKPVYDLPSQPVRGLEALRDRLTDAIGDGPGASALHDRR